MAKGVIKSPRSIARKHSNSRVFLDNALGDAVIGKHLAMFGYNKKKLGEGAALLATAEEAMNLFNEAQGKKLSFTNKLDKKWDEADAKFAVTRKVARILLGDDSGERKALMLNGNRGEALPLWLRQAKAMYSNLLRSKKRLDVMAEYNFTKAKLTSEYDMVKDVEKLDSLQENVKGAAQRVTKVRNKKAKALGTWTAQARKFARIALAEKPQLLEKLGITIES